MFVITYVSFVVFLCCSVQLVFSYFISFVTSALINDWYDFGNNILWVIYSIPYIHLLLGINLKIIRSYFKNIWKILSFAGIQSTIKKDLERGKCNRTVVIIKYIVIVLLILLIGTLVVMEILNPSEEAVYSIYIGILSVIVPLIGFLKILFMAIKSIFVLPEDLTVSLNNIQQDEIREFINEEEELKMKKKKVGVEQSLIDPCGVMTQFEYINFIKDADVNHFASSAKSCQFKKEMIPGLIIGALVIVSIILDTCAFVKEQKYKIVTSIIGYIIRIIFYLFSLPFLMIFNFTGLFINGDRVKEKHHFIRFMWIFVIIFYIAFLIAATIFLIIFNFNFHPFQLEELKYYPYDDYNTSNDSLYRIFEPTLSSEYDFTNETDFSDPVAICDLKYNNLTLLQYAGIAALGQSNSNLNVSKELLKYFFDGRDIPINFYGNEYIFAYTAEPYENTSVVAFNSLVDKAGISFLLENFFNDFIPSKIFRAVIPFYEITHNLILSRFMNILTEHLTFFIGVAQVSPRYVRFNLEFHNHSLENKTVVYTGHSIGGMLAKSMGIAYLAPSISFESLSYFRSLYQATMQFNTGEEFYDNRVRDFFQVNGFKMINAYSPSQFFSALETNATMNILLPRWKRFFDFVNPYDTMCTIAAGCSTDTRYDYLCNATIGYSQYLHLFKLWNRTRPDYYYKYNDDE